MQQVLIWESSLASCAIENNQFAQIHLNVCRAVRIGCNLVGCVGYKPIDNLNGEFKEINIDKGICNDCINLNMCDLKMRNECFKPSKYMGYYRALKYKRKEKDNNEIRRM